MGSLMRASPAVAPHLWWPARRRAWGCGKWMEAGGRPLVRTDGKIIHLGWRLETGDWRLEAGGGGWRHAPGPRIPGHELAITAERAWSDALLSGFGGALDPIELAESEAVLRAESEAV